MNAVKEFAYAKINLYLDVTQKRSDGFHELKTVMHTVGLADEITVCAEQSKGASQFKLAVKGADFLPTDTRNLAVRAAELFLNRLGIFANVNIKLEKRIPVASGLAGGSSDAAAVLRAMNRIFGKPFTDRAMLSMSCELGSDVPYCLIGKTALCTGRGEIMTRIRGPERCRFLIVRIPDHISTPAAYAALDKMYGNFNMPHVTPCTAESFADSLAEGVLDINGMYNIFESAVLPTVPSAERALKLLNGIGAKRAMMSGSGPTVFGVFFDKASADAAGRLMAEQGYEAYSVGSV